MTKIDPAKAAARESARARDGKFGNQEHAPAGITLGAAGPDAERLKAFHPGCSILRRMEDGSFLPGTVVSADGVTGQAEDTLIVSFDTAEEEAAFGELVTQTEAAEGIVAKLREKGIRYDLVYVHYDSKLSEEHMSALLEGDQKTLDGVYEDWSDNRFEGARAAVNGILQDEGLEEYDVDEEVLRDFAYDVDDSDVLDGLIRNTGDQLMRVKLGHVYGEGTFSGHDDGAWPARSKRIAEMLADQGLKIETDEQRSAIEELVSEGPFDWHDGVRLEVIYYSGLTESSVLDMSNGEVKAKDLTFEGPRVLLIDTVNGSGYDVKVPGTLNARIDADNPVMLDANPDFGYSWDDVCGLVKSAYRTEMKAEWVPDPLEGQEAA